MQNNTESTCDFFENLPPELHDKIFSLLDIQSLCRALQTSHKYSGIINSGLWKHYIRLVKPEDRENGKKNDYDWKDILRIHYGWKSGKFSNYTPDGKFENIMCPMSANTWGEIFEAECQKQ